MTCGNDRAIGRGAEYCDQRVCVSVRLSASISPELHVLSSPIFAHVTYGRGSVLLHSGVAIRYVLPVLRRHVNGVTASDVIA